MPAPLGCPWRWLPEGCRTTPVQHAGTVCWPGSAYRARAAKVSATQSAMKVHRQPTAHGTQVTACTVQEQYPSGAGALREQTACYSRAHGKPSRNDVIRLVSDSFACPLHDSRPADAIGEGESFLDRPRHVPGVQIRRDNIVTRGTEELGGCDDGRTQAVHGVEKRNACHQAIVPDRSRRVEWHRTLVPQCATRAD